MTLFDINVIIKPRKILGVRKLSPIVRGNRMKEVYVDLETATNYLVQLFYQTGRRYSCTRTKLGKMLAIVAFKYARADEIIFAESVYEYGEHCGAVISGLAMIVDRDAYLNYQYLDVKDDSNVDKIIDDERERKAFIPEKYKKTSGITDGVKDRIKEVFALFGGYSAPLIGHFINDLIYLPGVIMNDGTISLQKISELSINDIRDVSQSRLIKYLFE